jgi:MFS transporter, Spinster family, sphingosine-1-phosphate transporter
MEIRDFQVEEPRQRRWLGITWPCFAACQWNALVLLTLLNLLCYFDRTVIFPMFPFLHEEFQISDFRLGLLGSVFMIVHSLTLIPFGYWADRASKQKIMAGGVLVWSAATLLSGALPTVKGLLAARSLVGVGQGAFAPAGTAMVSDCFPASFRARVQAVFNLGMLVGGVLGLASGGLLAQRFGWRYAFVLSALPGFLLVIPTYRLRVPITSSPESPSVWDLLKNPAYMMVLLGGTFAVFAAAAFTTWGAVFGTRYHGFSITRMSVWLAVLVLTGSLAGVLLGGSVGDWLQARWSGGRALIIGASLLLGTPFLLVAVMTDSQPTFLVCIFLATFWLTCYHGPATAVIHDLTPPHAHSFAFALYLFVIHVAGDSTAPALIGIVADQRNLRLGMLVAVAATFLAALCFLVVTYLIRKRAFKLAQCNVS